jgi:serine/threonine protein kinase
MAAARLLGTPLGDVPAELAESSKYRILGKLGQGGMGAVYKAVQLRMERTVAIKVMSPEVVGNAEAVGRFQQEVKAAARLQHPNIVTAYDADQAGELHFLVMEYVEGVSLSRLVEKNGPLPVHQACHLVRQAALALQLAHDRGMVHRDVKPGNLMVTRKGQVKVLDFGLARLPRDKADQGRTVANTFMGTPEYVSPEQATDARSADIRSDIYSLGCTLYFLLTGAPPFRKGDLVETIRAHLQEEPPPLTRSRPDAPPELAAIVARMLAKARADRYQTPAELARALAPLAVKKTAAGKENGPLPVAPPPRSDGETVPPGQRQVPTQVATPSEVLRAVEADPAGETATPPPLPSGPAAARPRRRWALYAGGAAAVLALTLALGWALRPRPQPAGGAADQPAAAASVSEKDDDFESEVEAAGQARPAKARHGKKPHHKPKGKPKGKR